MANRIKSGIKRVQVAERNRLRNVAVKSEIKTRFKRVHETMKNDDQAQTVENLRKAISTIDRAVRKGIVHANTAARRKSRLVKAVNAATANA